MGVGVECIDKVWAGVEVNGRVILASVVCKVDLRVETVGAREEEELTVGSGEGLAAAAFTSLLSVGVQTLANPTDAGVEVVMDKGANLTFSLLTRFATSGVDCGNAGKDDCGVEKVEAVVATTGVVVEGVGINFSFEGRLILPAETGGGVAGSAEMGARSLCSNKKLTKSELKSAVGWPSDTEMFGASSLRRFVGEEGVADAAADDDGEAVPNQEENMDCFFKPT